MSARHKADRVDLNPMASSQMLLHDLSSRIRNAQLKALACYGFIFDHVGLCGAVSLFGEVECHFSLPEMGGVNGRSTIRI